MNDTHSKLLGYLLWIFGFTGSHRFYYGRPISGTIWFFTLGLFFIGWIIDVFLIPSMDRSADQRFVEGRLTRLPLLGAAERRVLNNHWDFEWSVAEGRHYIEV